MKIFKLLSAILALVALVGCATPRPPYDYTNFKASAPKSILVLPPKNGSPDVKASSSVYSHTYRPLAEAGYYVFPVALVDEMFKANGMSVPDDMHGVDPGKLQQIFGADAALYIEVKEYGTKYMVVDSAAIVTADAKLVDLRNGKLLWQGKATASSAENQNQSSGGLAGMLVGAIVKQILGNVLDQSHVVARVTGIRLLTPHVPDGMLYGPRHPLYGK